MTRTMESELWKSRRASHGKKEYPRMTKHHYPRTAIGDLVAPVETWNPQRFAPDLEFDYIDIASIDRESKSIIQTARLKAATAPSRARQIVRANDVLVSTVRPNLNAVAVVSDKLDGATASTGYCVLRPMPDRVHHRYLFHWARAPEFIGEMTCLATGANYPAVTDRTVCQSTIPLPPLSEQIRIAAILDQADEIRRKRRLASVMNRDLLRSSFVDLCGHPKSNPKDWPTAPLTAIASVNRGKFTPRPRDDPRYYNGTYPFIQTGELTSCDGVLRSWTQTLNQEGARVSRCFPPGTVCIAIVGATIGETAILGFTSYCPDSVIGIQPAEGKCTSEYVEYVLRFYKQSFRDAAPETARANINLQTLTNLLIPVPPITVQRHFSAIYHHLDRMLTFNAEHAHQANRLFDSIAQQAFRGEL